jgi:hypothetical protein
MKILNVLYALAFASVMLASTSVSARDTGRGGDDPDKAPVVYVTSQGLYYDSIVLTGLPMKGNFQQLIPGEMGLMTEYGPGQPGHLGGRWWIDVDESGTMNEGDKFFLCPLLGPGRETL